MRSYICSHNVTLAFEEIYLTLPPTTTTTTATTEASTTTTRTTTSRTTTEDPCADARFPWLCHQEQQEKLKEDSSTSTSCVPDTSTTPSTTSSTEQSSEKPVLTTAEHRDTSISHTQLTDTTLESSGEETTSDHGLHQVPTSPTTEDPCAGAWFPWICRQELQEKMNQG